MAKDKIFYRCSNCDHDTLRWTGRCPKCQAYNTMEKVVVSGDVAAVQNAGVKTTGAITPTKKSRTVNELNKDPIVRTPTGIGELDRVLGGGFVNAEVVLLGGVPGSGKSTLSLAIAEKFANMSKNVLYSSGEESEQQIGLRAQRLGVISENIHIVNETNLETLLGHISQEKPDFLIVDSLQTIASKEVPGMVGSVSQSKEAAHVLTRLAKNEGIIMLLISQLVKSGDFSGSEAVQHIVDATVMFESDNDTPLKFLRATKNRFGATDEIGVFQHGDHGLEEVSDPSGILLEETDENVTGTARTFISEGIRQIPVETQALVLANTLSQPRRQFNGVNFNRAQIIAAILDKFCKARLFENDLFISTVSGMKIGDPQADLAIAAAILSSVKERSIPSNVLFIGEMSLTGQVRTNFMVESKIREAQRLGFSTVYMSKSSRKLPRFGDIKIVEISSISELDKIIASF